MMRTYLDIKGKDIEMGDEIAFVEHKSLFLGKVTGFTPMYVRIQSEQLWHGKALKGSDRIVILKKGSK